MKDDGHAGKDIANISGSAVQRGTGTGTSPRTPLLMAIAHGPSSGAEWRGGQVSAPAAHCRVSATSPPDHGERPPCRQTHTTWAAKSAARCLSRGAQPWHAN